MEKILIIISSTILVLCLLLAAAFYIMIEPKAEWKFIPYSAIMSLGAYEHISYNSTEYFFMEDEDREKYIDYKYFSDEEIEVTVVDINGNAYDESKTETAHVYEGDTDIEFIIFNGEIYTKNTDMAGYWYKQKRQLD